jgi:hypothetical protein
MFMVGLEGRVVLIFFFHGDCSWQCFEEFDVVCFGLANFAGEQFYGAIGFTKTYSCLPWVHIICGQGGKRQTILPHKKIRLAMNISPISPVLINVFF